MNQLTKKLLKVIIFVILIAWVVYYVVHNINDFKQLELVKPIFIIPLLVLFVFTIYLNGVLNNSLTSAVGLKLSQKESFALSAITSFYNLITPFRGGMAARAVYLKKKYDFAYVNFISTLSAVYILIFLISSFVGLIAALLVYKYTGFFSIILFIILLGIFLAMLIITFFSPKFKERENKWLNRIVKVINGWNIIKLNKKVLFITILITLGQLIASALMLYLQFHAFDVVLTIPVLLFLAAISNLSIVIAITPGNLGIQEAITVFSATTIGITPAVSLAAAILGRAISVVVLFIIGPIFSYSLLKERQ